MTASPEEQIAKSGSTDPLLLEYDYFKHLSTIALVAMGAILTVAKGELARPALISLVMVTMTAVLAFSAMNAIIDHRKTGKKLRRFFRWERGVGTALFAFGLGIFMSELGKAVN